MYTASISVILPVFNGERFLAEAVASIRRQSVRPLEIIIVDDGSTDGTPELIRSLGTDVRSVSQPNAGPAAARNTGIRLAEGEALAFLDADDVWPDNSLAVLLAHLADEPRTDIVLGRVQSVVADTTTHSGEVLRPVAPPHRSSQLGSALLWADVFRTTGLFDETLQYSEDMDWFMRAMDKGIVIKKIDDVTLLYRLHEQSMTFGRDAHDLSILHVLRTSIARRRKSANPATENPL